MDCVGSRNAGARGREIMINAILFFLVIVILVAFLLLPWINS